MNTALVPVGSTAIVPVNRIGVAGLDHLDESDVALPYIRVVQPTSSECSLMDGGEAKGGQFYDTALRVARNELFFSILSVAKFQVVWQEGKDPQTIYLVLAADQDLWPFVLKVSGTSVFALKSLTASLLHLGAPVSWAYKVRAVTEKRESTKDGQPRKWFAIRFYIMGENDDEAIHKLTEMAGKFSLFAENALPPLEPDEIS